MTAVPVFLVRAFHHGAILVNTRAGIRTPKDLEGRRVGVNRGYTVTTGVWARSILQEEHDVDLDVRSEAAWQHGLRLYGAYDRDAGARDIAQVIRAAVHLPESSGRVALQGYCLGALMAFITAARDEVDAAVAYHGGDTEKYLGEVGGLHAPLLMHLGEEDEFISKVAQAEIKMVLAKKPNATVYSYPGQRHAFSRHNGLHYDAAAAALANGRTSEFLNQQLR